MYKTIKHKIGNCLFNSLGWHTNRKIIVIESDDWGSIRVPTNKILDNLIIKKVCFDLDLGFDKNDTIASPSDLCNLFEVLSSVKDKNNNPAILTANCVVANPDFEKIKKSLFLEYHYELITETMKRYYSQSNLFDVWKQGMNNNVFFIQFHGREHVNVQLWLKLLKNNLHGFIDAYNESVFSQIFKIPNDNRFHVLSAYDYKDKSEQKFIKNSIREGLNIFEDLFGYRSMSAIAPCNIWDDFIEKCYFEEGIKYIQGSHFQKYSSYQRKISNKNGEYHYLGEKNKYDQYFLIRNCHFEPTINPKNDYVDDCLSRIMFSFKWRKPSIISTHRVNFIGSRNNKNRDSNLIVFRNLLKQIVHKWPDIEFMTSNRLGELIRTTK